MGWTLHTLYLCFKRHVMREPLVGGLDGLKGVVDDSASCTLLHGVGMV